MSEAVIIPVVCYVLFGGGVLAMGAGLWRGRGSKRTAAAAGAATATTGHDSSSTR